MAVNVKKLSNDELRQCLLECGMKDIGPVQSTTRGLYEKQLRKRLESDIPTRVPTTLRLSEQSDDELRQCLLECGMNIGPVQCTTRGLYERQLRKRLESDIPTRVPTIPSFRHPHPPPCNPPRQLTHHRVPYHNDEVDDMSLDSLVLSNRLVSGPQGHCPLPVVQHTNIHYDWELLPEDIQFCARPDGSKWCLGQGGFGKVFKGLKDGVDEVAVKVTTQNQISSINDFKQEIDLISKLRHRNIVQFYGACIRPHCLYMVTELMQSDLYTALKTNRQYTWAGEYGREVCIGIATGIHYLHSRRPPIVHRDIKSPNVLLLDGLAKIADVGMAKAKMHSDMTAQIGLTEAWAAPEVIYRRRATEKIDIWSYGVILWEVVTGRSPGVGQLSMPSTAPVRLRSIYKACLDEDPRLRPATDEILAAFKTIT